MTASAAGVGVYLTGHILLAPPARPFQLQILLYGEWFVRYKGLTHAPSITSYVPCRSTCLRKKGMVTVRTSEVLTLTRGEAIDVGQGVREARVGSTFQRLQEPAIGGDNDRF